MRQILLWCLDVRPVSIETMDEEERSEWMSELPDELQCTPLYRLAIPGSHNSGAYNLSSELAADAPGFLQFLKGLPCAARLSSVLKKWCQCQWLCILDQLKAGIRYLDFRVSSKKDCDDLYFVHAVFGPKVTDALEQVKEFLDAHPGEVAILDFNHFYRMDTEHHQLLIGHIRSIFGTKLLPITQLENVTLKHLRNSIKQVICIYQHQEGTGHPLLWPAGCIHAPWPDTPKPDVCIEKLTSYMQSAAIVSPNLFIVCQGILTPDMKYVLAHNRRGEGVYTMTRIWRPHFISWIKDSPQQWPYQPNIVIHDFVEEGGFIQAVLDLNRQRIRVSP